MLWNAYNRVQIKYEIASDPSALDPVKNPHFTYHPAIMFHLKSNADSAQRDEAIFQGIADVGIVLNQDFEMPWIRAVSGRLSALKSPGARLDGIPSDDLVVKVPSVDSSVQIAIDFVRVGAGKAMGNASRWYFDWHDVAVRITGQFTFARVPTLSWFHAY